MNPDNGTTNSKENTPDGLMYSSDYTVKTLTIITSDGTVIDIKSVAVEINIYEDIFAPCVSGSILIGDAMDLITQYMIHGNEFLILEIDKPSLNKSIKKVFRIYKISDREYKSAALQNYVLHFTSEEMILSTQRSISKSYKGMTVSDMISDLLKHQLGVLDTKIAFMDKTEGIFNIIIPRLQPLEAISWLTTRAYSSNGTLYMFYENRDGYNFQSYETLLAKPTYQKYYKRPKITTDPSENINSVNYLKIIQDFDIIESGKYGAFNASLMTFDFINRRMTTSTVDASQFKLLNDNLPVNNAKNRFNQPLTKNSDYFIKFYPTTDSDPVTNASHPENWLHKKAAKLAQLHSFKMIVTIPGDLLMKAGTVIEVELPLGVPLDDSGTQINTMRSGRYLVSAVHHVFFNDVMSTVMEVLSDSISGKLNAPADSSVGVQAVRKA